MKIEKIDDRGFVASFKVMNKEYLLIYTKAGTIRGNHSHESIQFNILLDGNVVWNYRLYTSPSIIKTLSNEQHVMLSETDSLMIEWKE